MLDVIKSILNISFAEITVGDVIIVISCMFGALLIDQFVRWLFKHLSQKDSKGRVSRFKEIVLVNLRNPLHVLCLTLGCGLGLVIIPTPSWGTEIFQYIFIVMRAIAIWCVIWYLLLIVRGLTDYFSAKAAQTETKLDDMLVPIVSGLAKCLLIAIGILLVLQNLGFSVSSLLTGLGIGSAALALAAKDTLANLFGSLVVFLDHPFEIGDWISLNGIEGSVEEIRLRSTVIRTFENSVIMIPNQMLTTTYIDNFQRRKCRKMDCSFGVLYSTTQAQLQQIVNAIELHLKTNPDIYAPSYYVAFNGFGDSSLDIQVIAFTINTSKAEHMKDRQNFMFEIMRIVEKAGAGFAFPTRTLEIQNGTKDLPVHVVMNKA